MVTNIKMVINFTSITMVTNVCFQRGRREMKRMKGGMVMEQVMCHRKGSQTSLKPTATGLIVHENLKHRMN